MEAEAQRLPPVRSQPAAQPTHAHGIDSEVRAVVVGKCLTKATEENQVIDVLVDIAG